MRFSFYNITSIIETASSQQQKFFLVTLHDIISTPLQYQILKGYRIGLFPRS